MSTPPLLELPSSRCVASVVMTLERVVALTSSPFSRAEQAFRWPGEQWMADVALPTMKRDTAADWMAFGVSLEGRWGRFLMGDPSATTPRGVATGTPVVNGALQTGNTLVVDGFTPSTNNILRKGDYFQLGTGVNSRLYMITEDVNSDVSGGAALSFCPSLRSSPADNDPLVLQNPRGVFRLMDNGFSWSVSPGGFYRISFRAAEVVNA